MLLFYIYSSLKSIFVVTRTGLVTCDRACHASILIRRKELSKSHMASDRHTVALRSLSPSVWCPGNNNVLISLYVVLES